MISNIRFPNYILWLRIILLMGAVSLKAQATFPGDTVALGDGIVYTWIQIDGQGVPETIGVTITETVFSNLLSVSGQWTLNLPMVAVDSLFNHVLFDWNHQGHPPNGTYGLPHFDFHFCIVTQAEREAVIPGPDLTPVEPQFMPQDYRPIDDPPSAVPNMGVHWIDSLSSEWQGETFTKTMIYGFYQGEMFFVEPMITLDYLQSNPNVTLKLKQPQSFQREGYYPTNYSIEYVVAEQVYNIVIKDFVYSGPSTDIEEDELRIPTEYILFDNYPNPFNPSTIIEFRISDLPVGRQGFTFVSLKVYDVLGNEVETLVNEEKQAGIYYVNFNATGLTSGIYFYQLSVGPSSGSGQQSIETKKMILMK